MEVPFGPCEVHTQSGFSSQDDGEAEDDEPIGTRGCLDLVIESEDPKDLVAAIEVKIWSRFGINQIAKYRKALETHYGDFRSRHLITITPFPESPPEVDHHIQWGQVVQALEETEDESMRLSFRQFASFLKNRGLGHMKLDKLNPKVLNEWQKVAEVQAQWSQLLGLFGNDEELQPIFKRATERPCYDCESGSYWVGIYTRKGIPEIYAGFGVFQSGKAVLWVEVGVTSKQAKAVSKLPKSLIPTFEAARGFLDPKTDLSANFGKSDDEGNTYFEFAQEITPEFDGRSERILEWFKATIVSAHKFGVSLCK